VPTLGCADALFDGYSAREPADAAVAVDTAPLDTGAFEAEPLEAAGTFCSTAPTTADLCDDFESGVVSPKWIGVESSGGVLAVTEGRGRVSRYALVAQTGEGSGHVMAKAQPSGAIKGADLHFFIKLDMTPSDPTKIGLIAIAVIAGYEAVAISLAPQPGGSVNADLWEPFTDRRQRVGVITNGAWMEVRLEVLCEPTCTARATLAGSVTQSLTLQAKPSNPENSLQAGISVATAGGAYNAAVDDLTLTWTR
jgi:hypothetical protein